MTAPAGIVDGDILIAVVNSATNGDIATLSGFTQKSTRTTTNRAGQQTLLWKRASGESGNYTTGTPTGILWGHVICVKNAIATGDPFDTVALTDTPNSGTTMTCAAITPAVNLDLILAGYYQLTASLTHSAYTGGGLTWTQDHQSGTANTTNSVASAPQTTAGSVTASATTSGTGFTFEYAMAILASADVAAGPPLMGQAWM